MSLINTIRRGVFEAIKAKKNSASPFTFNNFEIVQTLDIKEMLETIFERPTVIVQGLNYDAERIVRTPQQIKTEIPVQVAFRYGLIERNETLEDSLLEMVDELQVVAIKVNIPHYTWQRNESLKDDNGMPFTFKGLRENSIFESFFTAYYQAHASI